MKGMYNGIVTTINSLARERNEFLITRRLHGEYLFALIIDELIRHILDDVLWFMLFRWIDYTHFRWFLMIYAIYFCFLGNTGLIFIEMSQKVDTKYLDKYEKWDKFKLTKFILKVICVFFPSNSLDTFKYKSR